MYIPLSRKYRPKTFDDVIGQNHISQTLINAIKTSHISHAYLFSGPRGTGKTTIARILAKAINCESENINKPCYNCKSCLDVSQDIIEIDGASNRGIDEIRNIKENVNFSPLSSKYKIYIIDEVHMLTEQAFNALLKTLEEPPNFIVFMFATTEVHKIPETILSRCQKFNVKLISLELIEKRLSLILDKEKITHDKDSIKIISKLSNGSMRDALSLLDQVIAYSPNNINITDTSFILGIINSEIIFETVNDIISKNIKLLLEKISIIEENGFSLVQFLSQIRNHFRNLMLIKSGISIDYNDEIYDSQKDKMTLKKIIKNIDIINQTMYEIKTQDFPKTSLELCLIKLTFDDDIENIENTYSEPKINTNFFAGRKTSEIKSDKKEKKIVNENIKTDENLDKKNILEKNAEDTLSINDNNTGKTEKLNLESKNINFLEMLNKNWELFLSKISNEKIFLTEYLKNNTGIEINNKNIKFSFTVKFYADGVNRNKEIIEKILKEILKTDFSVSVNFEPYKKNKDLNETEPLEKEIKQESINKNSFAPEPKKEIINEKVKKVLEIIGGEILD